MQNKVVYVTKSKINQILKTVDLQRSNVGVSNLYKENLTGILSAPELMLLALYKEFEAKY